MREITAILGLIDKPIELKVPRDLVNRSRIYQRSYIDDLQHIFTMSRYKLEFPFEVAFPPQAMTDVLAEWLSKEGISQAHVAGRNRHQRNLAFSLIHVSFPRD
jgi:2,3-bisphosphoglycerate-independent phosphoglycerate mutase